MEMKLKTTKAITATKAIFLVCGLAISSWAPMVPYAKDRLGINDADLGILLLLLGAGAIAMMPVSGILSHKYGTRRVILVAALATALILPLLLVISSPIWMGVSLFLFGGALGTVDVAMNAHGVQVQNSAEKPIMSSLHGLFSVGGLFGSLGLGFLIKMGLPPITAIVAICILLICIVSWNFRFLFDMHTEKELIAKFAAAPDEKKKTGVSWLQASILFLGLMCFITFLSEGAMLDWSAIFLRENKGVAPELAGVGYAAFSVAMATMRLLGDRIISRLDGKTVVVGGSVIAAAGIFIAVAASWLPLTLFGFILLGIGAANIVPVFFSEGGRIRNVPATIAIPVISTMGYAGQLAGPAMLGYISFRFSIDTAFLLIAFLMLIVALTYGLRKTSKI
ncbi:MFS transporter [Sphingobacterium spiritivorum]|uniref:MFS transporter n=2 Tax=Sphingobacterium spiritivorum TaxID=258 RepID=UPI003DA6624C